MNCRVHAEDAGLIGWSQPIVQISEGIHPDHFQTGRRMGTTHTAQLCSKPKDKWLKEAGSDSRLGTSPQMSSRTPLCASQG